MIQTNIINYHNSPDGKADIGIAKTPIVPTKKWGFKGIKLQTIDGSLVECHECGEWYKALSHFHLKKHGLTHDDYRKKYGLNTQEPLCSNEFSIKSQKKLSQLLLNKRPAFPINNKHWKKANRQRAEQRRNNLGVCDLQIGVALKRYIDTYKRLPTKRHSKGFTHITTMQQRHGSYTAAKRYYGLPTMKNGTYTFADNSKLKINNLYSFDILYEKIKETSWLWNNNLPSPIS